MDKSQSTNVRGYRLQSIVLHWLSALAVFALYVSGAQGPPLLSYHVTAGTILGTILGLHVVYRLTYGIPALPPDKKQSTLVRNVIIWIFLAMMICLVTTGMLLPWASGSAVEFFDIRVTAPAAIDGHLMFIPLLHKVASFALVPLVILHIMQAPEPERIFKSDKEGS